MSKRIEIERELKPSKWIYDEQYDIWLIDGKHCSIWLEERPKYCDRGNFLAHLERTTTDPRKLHVDEADCWPRYYFIFENARSEVEAWLKKRNEWR